eukprot:TRINITY_DN13710_c0_g1_i1.p3 TRINITY_DN13710_c0_g1~~TRINITY_DN13710_c0_g1_i1.p3  ORF type:complete len:108 (+),score=1.53 TRINITY_DN13710_c0_g1_i1:725-1048(+)
MATARRTPRILRPHTRSRLSHFNMLSRLRLTVRSHHRSRRVGHPPPVDMSHNLRLTSKVIRRRGHTGHLTVLSHQWGKPRVLVAVAVAVSSAILQMRYGTRPADADT